MYLLMPTLPTTFPIMPHFHHHGAYTQPHTRLIIKHITHPTPQKHQICTHHKWGITLRRPNTTLPCMLAAGHPLRSPLTFPHYISHYAPFPSSWGTYTTTQSIDNQTHHTPHTPKISKYAHITNGAFPTPLTARRSLSPSPLSISHYAPFAAPWGIHNAVQSTDNQTNSASRTLQNTQKKNTHHTGHCIPYSIQPRPHPHSCIYILSHFAAVRLP